MKMEKESKYVSVLSWADEVEKEEEEAQTHAHQKQKLNPFGSARPREVVLQERGIHWRKLDQDLQTPSNIRNMSLNEKQSKENIPVPNAPVVNTIQSFPQSRGQERKPKDTKSGSKRGQLPWVPLAAQNQIPVMLSPPLRYPPKNVIPRLLEESSICYNGCGLDNLQRKNDSEAEKEKKCMKQRFQKAHSLDPRSHIHPHFDQQIIWCESQSGVFKNTRTESEELGLPMEAPRTGKSLRKPAACKNQQDAGSGHERRLNMQNLVRSSMVNEKREPLLRQDKRWSLANERERKNLQGGARHDRTGCRGVHYDTRIERSFTETELEIIEFENGRQKVAKTVTGPSIVAVGSGTRATTNQNTKMKKANCDVNHRKKSGGIRIQQEW